MIWLHAGALLLAAAAHVHARPPADDPLNACQVLTKREVVAVQGEAYVDTKLSTRGSVSQCFYQLPTFTKSISVDLVRESGRDYWQERFGEEDKKHPPLRVRGVGDEAFWAGGPLTGSLYVRKGDAVVRVSVGGPWKEKEKIDRSKKLAAKALRRVTR